MSLVGLGQKVPVDTQWDPGLILCRSRRLSERLPPSATEAVWLKIKARNLKGINTRILNTLNDGWALRH